MSDLGTLTPFEIEILRICTFRFDAYREASECIDREGLRARRLAAVARLQGLCLVDLDRDATSEGVTLLRSLGVHLDHTTARVAC